MFINIDNYFRQRKINKRDVKNFLNLFMLHKRKKKQIVMNLFLFYLM